MSRGAACVSGGARSGRQLTEKEPPSGDTGVGDAPIRVVQPGSTLSSVTSSIAVAVQAASEIRPARPSPTAEAAKTASVPKSGSPSWRQPACGAHTAGASTIHSADERSGGSATAMRRSKRVPRVRFLSVNATRRPATLTAARITSPARIRRGASTAGRGRISYVTTWRATPRSSQVIDVPICSGPAEPSTKPPSPTQTAAPLGRKGAHGAAGSTHVAATAVNATEEVVSPAASTGAPVTA